MSSSNPQRRAALVWVGIFVLGVVVVFIPGIIGLDGFDGGFALSFLGIFIALFSIIAVVIYLRLARALNRVLKGKNLLAHWSYSPAEWKEYTEKEKIEDTRDRRNLFLLIAVITVIVGVVFWLVVQDHPEVMLLCVLGIVAVTGLTAWLTAQANYRQNKKYPGEAFIALDGVYLNRQLHLWKGLGNSLEEIACDGSLQQPRIIISYSSPARDGRNYYTVRVPVPSGQEEVAQRIVKQISDSHLSDQ